MNHVLQQERIIWLLWYVFLFSQQEMIQMLNDEWLLYLQSHVLLQTPSAANVSETPKPLVRQFLLLVAVGAVFSFWNHLFFDNIFPF